MRVAILADPIDNQNAGVHVFTREMVYAMIRTNPGHEIILIREKTDVHLSGASQISVWNTRLPIGFASLRLFLIVPLLLNLKRVNVVLEPAHFGPFNLSKKTKRVTVIHDLTPILFPELHRWHSQILQKIFLKGILNKTDLIVANSDNTAKDICKVYTNNCRKVKRIYPGKSSIYKPTIDRELVSKYHIHLPYFLFVGTIEPRKNLIILLEAFRLFKQANAGSCMLVIVGGMGWKSEAFNDALENHPFKDQILCTGFVQTSDLPALYSQSIALIYPSLYEGFGLPIVEAMSCGTPVITCENSSLPEAGGDAALYFDTADTKKLVHHMSNLFSDESLRIKQSALAIEHAKKFDWDLFARELWLRCEELHVKS